MNVSPASSAGCATRSSAWTSASSSTSVGLLSVGYQADEERLDELLFDLLASEARVASYVAIAKGRRADPSLVPPRPHRHPVPPTPHSSPGQARCSECLMPLLVMRHLAASLLERTADLVVARQIDYGNQLSIPWGSGVRIRAQIGSHVPVLAVRCPRLGIVRGPSPTTWSSLNAQWDWPRWSLRAKRQRTTRVLTRLGARGATASRAIDFTASGTRVTTATLLVRCHGAPSGDDHRRDPQRLDGLMRQPSTPNQWCARALLLQNALRVTYRGSTPTAKVEAAPNVRAITPPSNGASQAKTC